MPPITRSDGRTVTDPRDAEDLIRLLGLGVEKIAPAHVPALDRVLAERRLGGDDADHILAANRERLPAGHAGADVVALFPGGPGLGDLPYRRPHTHADDEVRFIVAGGGAFGFVLPDGGQIELGVEAGDLLSIPAGTEHWFKLRPDGALVAVRLFGANPDWRGHYTATKVLFRPD